MDPVDDLATVPPAVFDRVWKIVAEIGRAERHFNSMQHRYRALASTWMLASFAGAGFIFKEWRDTSQERNLLLAGIGTGGAIGIVLLWILDLLIYHRLLDCNFVEGVRLEQLHLWLPPIRSNMIKVHGKRGVTPKAVLFYLISSAVLFAFGAAFALLSFREITPALIASAAIALLACLTLIPLVRTCSRIDKALQERLPPLLDRNPTTGE